jgi:HK97 family phage portal protein
MSRLPRPRADSTLERLVREYFGGGTTSSGVSVNSDNAMRMMTVNNCIRVLFNCVSQMPCQLMKEVEEVKTKAKDHPLYKVISKRPNRWMTSPQFWGLAIVHVCLRGNFYAFKVKVGNQVRELLPIHPDRVIDVTQNPDWSLTYKISDVLNINGKSQSSNQSYRNYSQDEIFHIRGLSLNGYVGLNPIQYAREAIGVGLASEKFLANYFGQGMHPGAVIKYPGSLDPVLHANLWTAYKQKYSGLKASSDLMLLDNGMDIDFPSIKLVDAQFLEQMRFTEAQICGLYGVPLILVQAGSTPATFASSLQFKQSFVDFTIAPIAVNFETTIDKDLLNDKDQDTHYAKYNMGSLLRGNMAERFAAYAIGLQNKFMNSNQVRGLEDWNAREGGDIYENPNISINEESDKAKQDDSNGSSNKSSNGGNE